MSLRRSSCLLGCVVLAASLLACSHAAPAPRGSQPAPDTVAGLLAAAYRALESGEADELTALLTTDAMVYGLGPSDTWSSRAETAARLGPHLLPLNLGAQKLSVTESRPGVGLAASGRSGWVFDLPLVTLAGASGASQWLPRVTAHAIREGDSWRFDAVHVSLGVPDELVFAPDAAKLLLPPAEVVAERGVGAEELVGLTRRVLDDFTVKIQHISDRAEFCEIGSAPTETFEGGKRFRALVMPLLSTITKAGYSWKLDGGLKARVAPDGQTGWAAGNVVLRIGAGPSAQVLPTFRTLWIYVEEKGGWNLAAEHQSLGVKEDLRTSASEQDLKAFRLRKAQAPARLQSPIDPW